MNDNDPEIEELLALRDLFPRSKIKGGFSTPRALRSALVDDRKLGLTYKRLAERHGLKLTSVRDLLMTGQIERRLDDLLARGVELQKQVAILQLDRLAHEGRHSQ